MAKVTYKFPVKEFSASEGYDYIKVSDGKLEIETPVDPRLLALIERHGGILEVEVVFSRGYRGRVTDGSTDA